MRFLRVQHLYAEGLTAEDALDIAEARAERSGRIMVASAKVLLFVFFLGSVALALTGFSVNLQGPLPGIGIGLTAFTLIPGLLQTLDWLWPDAPIGRYRLAFERLNGRFTGFIQRHTTARVLARYGRQDLARRILPEEQAARYGIAAWLRWRKRRRQVASAVFVLIAAGGIAGLAVAGQSASAYRLGQSAVVGGFSAEAVSRPDCISGRTAGGAPDCSVEMRFRNVSNFPSLLGPGSFTSIGPDGNSSADYAVALISNGNYYDLYDASIAGAPGELQPDQTVTVVLTFTVPGGIHPGALQLESETTGAGIRIEFP